MARLIVSNILMIGSPGSGKSMLAARLPSILPPLSPAELLEVSMIASVAGEIQGGPHQRRHAGQARRDLAGASRRADGAEKIGRLQLAEALSYRALAEDLRRAA